MSTVVKYWWVLPRSIMIETNVGTVAISSPRTIEPETCVSRAAEQLRSTDVSALVVLDTETVVGIVTESDIVALVAETDERPPVSEILSSPVTTVSPHSTVREAAERMRTAGVSHLPVVEDGVYYGLVSTEQIAPFVSRHKVDIEWHGERTRVETTDHSGATASN